MGAREGKQGREGAEVHAEGVCMHETEHASMAVQPIVDYIVKVRVRHRPRGLGGRVGDGGGGGGRRRRSSGRGLRLA